MADEIEFDNEIYKVLLDKFHDELSNDLKGYYTWDFNEETLNEFKVSSACKKSIPHKDKKDDNNKTHFERRTQKRLVIFRFCNLDCQQMGEYKTI